jgi:hypothetical protein
MANKKKSSKARHKPLTISIHGRGVAIDATIGDASGVNALAAILLDQLGKRAATAQSVQPDHDFDIVQRAIKHGDLSVLQAIIDLATHELVARQTAS